MQQWYQTREGIEGVTHRGLPLPPKKKVFLTEEQATLINKYGEKVVTSQDPQTEGECARYCEWESFKANAKTEVKNPEPTEDKEQSSFKGNRKKGREGQ